MASPAPAARVGDPFGHTSAMNGVVIGLAVGAMIGAAILTGGMSLIAVGAAVAITGGAGMAGQAIGQTIPGPETGEITIGSPDVFIEGRAAAMTVIAQGICRQDSGPPVPVATGAALVLVNAQPAGRVGEKMGCSAEIRRGSPTVFIGGPSKTVIQPVPEVPVWLENTMLAMAIGGTAIGTLGVGLTYGAGAAVGSLVGGMAGGHYGGQAATSAAAAMGYGATGQAVAGVLGGTVGGALGGGLGFKGGQLRDIAANRATAQNFYSEQGWPQARIDSHLKGIDFSQPVKVVDFPADRQMSQWQVPGGPKGNYFSAAEETPGRLGISPVGHDPQVGAVSKIQTQYTSVRPTRALRSTAAPVDDFWSSPYGTAETPGGGKQFFVPDQDAFQP